jgi:hypothetical protein
MRRGKRGGARIARARQLPGARSCIHKPASTPGPPGSICSARDAQPPPDRCWSPSLSSSAWRDRFTVGPRRSKRQPAQQHPEACELAEGGFQGDQGLAKQVGDAGISTRALRDRVPGRPVRSASGKGQTEDEIEDEAVPVASGHTSRPRRDGDPDDQKTIAERVQPTLRTRTASLMTSCLEFLPA